VLFSYQGAHGTQSVVREVSNHELGLGMMEIPAGKWCRGPWGYDPRCDLYHSDVEGHDLCIAFKSPGEYYTDLDCDEDYGKKGAPNEFVLCPLRCPACLSAYPNGAVVTITAKEKG
jgi:hypothetical protein